MVCMELVKNADGPTSGIATISSYIETTFLVRISKMENTNVTDTRGYKLPLPYHTILDRRLPGEPPKQFHIFDAHPLTLDEAYTFRFRFFYHIGSYLAKHDDTAHYRFPFSGVHKISQGYNGGFSHKGAQIYSVDIKLPVGTPLYAPRSGIIAIAFDNNNRSKFEPGLCPKPVTVKCKAPLSDDNNIVIRYDDGTYGYLAHLQYKGNVVSAGTRVHAGQLISHSGNTGYSKGPHLHMMQARSLSYDDRRHWFFSTIEVKYLTAKDQYVIPEKGHYYHGPGLASRRKK